MCDRVLNRDRLARILLIMEGIPFLAFVHYLDHKKKMYLLERGEAERAREES